MIPYSLYCDVTIFLRGLSELLANINHEIMPHFHRNLLRPSEREPQYIFTSSEWNFSENHIISGNINFRWKLKREIFMTGITTDSDNFREPLIHHFDFLICLLYQLRRNLLLWFSYSIYWNTMMISMNDLQSFEWFLIDFLHHLRYSSGLLFNMVVFFGIFWVITALNYI